MPIRQNTLNIPTRGKGLHPITPTIQAKLDEWQVQNGLCTLFLQHTSASLFINESYDLSARIDLEDFLERLAPESQAWYRHTVEGADDSSAHLRAALLPVSLSIPLIEGKLALGTWQGVYLFEHRTGRHERHVVLQVLTPEK
jgi:secondary thiamine-phosphate synthase enzyme